MTDPEIIEDIPINRNRQHLGQAQGTLFTTPEVLQLIGRDGCSAGADSVLDGTANTSHMKLTPLQQTYFPAFNTRKTKIKVTLKKLF